MSTKLLSILNKIEKSLVTVNIMSIKGAKGLKNSIQKEDKDLQGPISINKLGGVSLTILAKPGAKQNAITGFSEEGVAVQIAAPPSEGEANKELVKFLASSLALRKSDITLEKGFKSRTKIFNINSSLTCDEIKSKILELCNQ